jgi:hypothetical protein
VVFSKNKQRLRHLQTQGTPLPGPGETYDSQCLVYGGLDITGYSWILQVCWDVECIEGLIHSAAGPLRLAIAPIFVNAMAFVEARVAIASRRGAAARVPSRRSAGKSSWRRAALSRGEAGNL